MIALRHLPTLLNVDVDVDVQCWVNKEFISPVKTALLCSLVLDVRALDVWPI